MRISSFYRLFNCGLIFHAVLAGRTYPLEGEIFNITLRCLLRTEMFSGSAVPLPQFAPYTDPLQILICGGSTTGAGFALDNCVTIAPESAKPTWTLERMVSPITSSLLLLIKDGKTRLLLAFETCNAVHSLSTGRHVFDLERSAPRICRFWSGE